MYLMQWMSAATIALQGEEEEEEEEVEEEGEGEGGGKGGGLERAPAMRMRVDDLQKEVGARGIRSILETGRGRG